MNKILYIFIFLINLQAKEPTIAFLNNIISNEMQELSIGVYSFVCVPYGVVTLEELYRTSKDASLCKKSIIDFYKKNKDLEFYVYKKMDIGQSYSIVFKEKQCLINVAGEKSYSEILLDKGLAFKAPKRLEKEYEYTFYKAQREAKMFKKGIWANSVTQNCISSIYIRE